MPRQARLDAPETLHHVMIRGIKGILIFRDNRGWVNRISLAELARRLGVCTSAIAKALQKKERQMSKV
jgi:hypothetical protein